MSMGYDDDDPRREAVLEGLADGRWKLRPGHRANVKASKRRAGAIPNRFGIQQGKR